jgi:hypothetical protein
MRRPLLCISHPFQVGSASTTLSTSGCNTDHGSLSDAGGMLTYLIGNSTIEHGKLSQATYSYSSLHLVGAIWHFMRLHARLDAPWNMSKINLVSCRSPDWGQMNKMTSSA